MDPSRALLTPAEMYRADALAVKAGVPSLTLMENAGRAVADEIVRRYGARPVTVLVGPGNNGGDGFVAARYLRAWGWPVDILSFGRTTEYRGDAAQMVSLWGAESVRLSDAILRENSLIIDALFGAGLSKPLPPAASALAREAARMQLPIVAVDIPSGLDGATGQPLGECFQADLTVTFFRKNRAMCLPRGGFSAARQSSPISGFPTRCLPKLCRKCVKMGLRSCKNALKTRINTCPDTRSSSRATPPTPVLRALPPWPRYAPEPDLLPSLLPLMP